MEFDTSFQPATYDSLREGYEARRRYIAEIANPRHRKIARNYYLHSLLEIGGRYEEILDPELSYEQPHYYFHHLDLDLDGFAAVHGFYRNMFSTKANVIVSDGHHFALADWGFTLEQQMHFYLTPQEFSARTGEAADPDAVYVEHRHTMRAWPYDEHCRMIGETLYYAQVAGYSRLDRQHALEPGRVQAMLAPMIEQARREWRENPPPTGRAQSAFLTG